MLSRTKKRRKFKDSFKNCIDGLRFININEDNFKREILKYIPEYINEFHWRNS